MSWFCKSIALLQLFVCINVTYSVELTSVETDVGIFKGYVRTQHAFGQEYKIKRFLGIPYAKPPIGELRFQKPESKEKLSEPYDATQFGAFCSQQVADLGGKRKPIEEDTIRFSEDCLFLNIFVPDGNLDSVTSLPVMIFIHGGGFVFGSSTIYPGDILSGYGNVIVVTINYRLSVWGFLSTGDENLPGNLGLWDQHLAIQWVRKNIASFGGDPDTVTLFGESAGAVSVVYQGLYPGNSDLFQRMIAQSGSITCPWAFSSDPLPAAKRIGALLGCANLDSSKLVSCIKSKSTEEINAVLNDDKNRHFRFPAEFIPVVDGEFIPESPRDIFHGTSEMSLLYRNSFRGYDLMSGVTSNEGLFCINPIFGIKNTEDFKTDRLEIEKILVPRAANEVFGRNTPEIVHNLITAEYTDWTNPNDNTRETYVQLSGDYNVNVQAIETVQLHADGLSVKATYLYLYDALPSQHLAQTPTWASKPNHADELTFLFGYDSQDGYTAWTTPYTETMPEQWELEMSKTTITLWTNFAKSGDPNGPVDITDQIKTTWPKYNHLTEQYLNISQHMSPASVGQRLFAKTANFWQNVLPRLISAVKSGPDDTREKVQSESFCEKESGCSHP